MSTFQGLARGLQIWHNRHQFQNVLDKMDRQKQESFNIENSSHAVGHFSFWCDFRAGVRHENCVNRQLYRRTDGRRPGRATFALVMLIEGVNTRLSFGRQVKRRLTGNSSALKFAMASLPKRLIFENQIIEIYLSALCKQKLNAIRVAALFTARALFGN